MTEMSAVPFSRWGRSRRSRGRSRGQSKGRGWDRGNRGRGNPRTEFSETRMVHLEVQNIITPLTCKNCFVTCLKTKIFIILTNTGDSRWLELRSLEVLDLEKSVHGPDFFLYITKQINS